MPLLTQGVTAERRRSGAGRPVGVGLAGRRSRVRRAARPYIFLLPALLVLALFVYWPVVQVGLLSLYEWNMVSPTRVFVGIHNFADFFGDADSYRLLLQSLFYLLIALLGNFLLPIGLALLTLQVGKRYGHLYQALLFTPTVVATAVGTLLWQFIYLPSGGPLNAALAAADLPGGNWLNDPGTALTAVGVVAAWKHLGFNYLIALAGLVSVPRDYLEAARVDGATGWPLVRTIVLPLLMPTTLFLALTTILEALPHAFIPIRILTGGGPSNATSNLLYEVYQSGFRFFQVGKASAEAVVLMALLGGAAVWQFRLLDRKLVYDR